MLRLAELIEPSRGGKTILYPSRSFPLISPGARADFNKNLWAASLHGAKAPGCRRGWAQVSPRQG